VFTAIAALALASASAQPPVTPTSAAPASPALTTSTPWWERVTVTVTDDGKTHSCRYESSLQGSPAQNCSVSEGTPASAGTHAASAKDGYTRITFERRFSPGTQVTAAALQPGEKLLGGQVMALAIDSKGAVKNCRVVSTSGSVTPQYGCDEAAAERFDASASTGHPRTRTPERAGYMTVLVYGHSEHIV
jgi:hypothetical protein